MRNQICVALQPTVLSPRSVRSGVSPPGHCVPPHRVTAVIRKFIFCLLCLSRAWYWFENLLLSIMTNPKSSLRWREVYKTEHPFAYLDGSWVGNRALNLAVGKEWRHFLISHKFKAISYNYGLLFWKVLCGAFKATPLNLEWDLQIWKLLYFRMLSLRFNRTDKRVNTSQSGMAITSGFPGSEFRWFQRLSHSGFQKIWHWTHFCLALFSPHCSQCVNLPTGWFVSLLWDFYLCIYFCL